MFCLGSSSHSSPSSLSSYNWSIDKGPIFFKGSNGVTSKEILAVSAGNEKIVIGQFITDYFGLQAFLSLFRFVLCVLSCALHGGKDAHFS